MGGSFSCVDNDPQNYHTFRGMQPASDNCTEVLHFQPAPGPDSPPARRIPAIPRPVLVVVLLRPGGCGGTLAIRMAPFISYLYHVNCFLYLDKGLVPPPTPPVQLPPSLAHSILQSQQIDFEAI